MKVPVSNENRVTTRPVVGRRMSGFTVIELLVAVSVMSVIVYGLFVTFSQTQRALHSNMAQVDILETGRSAMGLITRELEELSAVPPAVLNQTNLFIEMSESEPLRQPLLVAGNYRTNQLQDFFFLTRLNNQWTGIGYLMRATNGVGTLYRYQTTNVLSEDLGRANLSQVFRANRNRTNLLQAVAEGVVHLRLRTYQSAGVPIEPDALRRMLPGAMWAAGTESRMEAVSMWLGLPSGATNLAVKPPATMVTRDNNAGMVETRFMGPALPAYVEVELGVLDPKVYEKFRALAVNRFAATNFLAQQAGNVHLFRQRVPIRTAPR